MLQHTVNPVLAAEAIWLQKARYKQKEPLPGPNGDWDIWLLMAGRGFGKTRTGAEWVRKKALEKKCRIAVVAPTIASAREVCVEGDSGLLNVIPEVFIENWNRSMGELTLTNGTAIKTYSADTPDRLRGPQFHYAWVDELASFEYPESWDQLQFGMRLGKHPKTIVTTTPRPVPLIQDLLKSEHRDVHVTRGSTFENEDNLAEAALIQLKARYEGTTLGRQELYAEILDDVEGALWNRQLITNSRVSESPALIRIVIGIDPAGGGTSEIGIIAAGLASNGHGYVLADKSLRGTPEQWASTAISLYLSLSADRVVGEKNYGGDMVESTLRSVDPAVSYKGVTASRGKTIRAEPVAALYEQGKIHHVGIYPQLEDQMCSFVAGEGRSPDRLDALVWALTELMVNHKPVPDISPVSIRGESYWRH